MRFRSFIYVIASVVSAWTLSGCTEPQDFNFPDRIPMPAVSFATLQVEGRGLDRAVLMSQVTPISDFPRTGQATYHGAATFGDFQPASFANPFLLGRVTLEADFESKDIGGEIDNLRFANTAFSGDGLFDIKNGRILNNKFSATVDGKIVNTETQAFVPYAGNMQGTFRGSGAALVSGGIQGKLYPDTQRVTMDGLFHARRQ